MKRWIIRYRTQPGGKVRKIEAQRPFQPSPTQALQFIPSDPWSGSRPEIVSIQAAH